jgi:hypothetical protein
MPVLSTSRPAPMAPMAMPRPWGRAAGRPAARRRRGPPGSTAAVGTARRAVWHIYGTKDPDQRRAAALGNARDFFDNLPTDAYPQFRRLVPVLTDRDEQEQFMRGLDLILAGLRAAIPDRASEVSLGRRG